MAIGPNVIDDCEGMTEEEYYRGMDEVMKRQIETTDVDVEATAWAIATLEALHVDCMSTENAAMMERLRKMAQGPVDVIVSQYPACKGKNCGCIDGRSHSAECIAEHEECAKMPYDEKYLHCPDTGTGWKCYVCGYGGTANNYANTFCVNCHCHR